MSPQSPENQPTHANTGHSRFSAVYIVTYGRSGSTLLQGLLNSIPGYEIRGENYNATYHLFRHYRSLVQADQQGGRESTHPWFNSFDLKEAIPRLREMHRYLLSPSGDTEVVGFKEIRYNSMEREELFALLDFLELLTPGSAIIFSTRDLRDVARSEWWQQKPPFLVRRNLRRFEGHTDVYTRLHPDRCYSLDYEDLLHGTDTLRQLFDFLGETFDERTYEETTSVSHSYPSTPLKRRHLQTVKWAIKRIEAAARSIVRDP